MSRRSGSFDAVRRFAAAGLTGLLFASAGPAPAAAVTGGHWWQDTWGMEQVWRLSDGAGITVAVIDSGVDAAIPELVGAVVPGADFVDDSGDGTTDHDPERDGHGTAMASLIAGRGGDSGVVGVAPAATVLPIAVATSSTQIADSREMQSQAIRYAVDRGAQVINMSISSENTYSVTEDCADRVAAAVRYALSQDVIVVGGSGNVPDGRSPFPGSCPGVLTVGALDPDLGVWENSHRSQHVDLAAPAVGVTAVRRGGAVRTTSGTSIATALVSGSVALVRAAYPDASAYEVVARMLATAQDLGPPGRDDATGHGMVRPYQALTADVPPDAPNPVFDGAGDLTDTADRGGAFTPPTREIAPAPIAQPGAQPSGPPPLLLPVVAALLLLLAVAVLAWRWSRRSGRPPAARNPPSWSG